MIRFILTLVNAPLAMVIAYNDVSTVWVKGITDAVMHKSRDPRLQMTGMWSGELYLYTCMPCLTFIVLSNSTFMRYFIFIKFLSV
ncbi:hypothetical protein KSS87_022123, partial [Heliosperma pusillum]